MYNVHPFTPSLPGLHTPLVEHWSMVLLVDHTLPRDSDLLTAKTRYHTPVILGL